MILWRNSRKTYKVNAFVISFKQNSNRLTHSLRSMLALFQRVFGALFWNNVVLEATNWSHGESAARIRGQQKEAAVDRGILGGRPN